jgi:glutathione S-transferase
VRGGGKYFADNRLTVADLKASVLTGWVLSGLLDHVPADLAQRVAPKLVEHQKRVNDDPIVSAYYNSRS